jgi:hypothetical protein
MSREKVLPKWHFSDGPGRIVGEVGGQDANAQLRVPIEVEEAVRTVDIVEGGEGGHASVDRHGVEAQLAPARQEKPVRVGT